MKNLILIQQQVWASLLRSPGFVTSVVFTMGLSLAALLCALTLGYVLFAKPLPYAEQDKLIKVNHYLQRPDNGGSFNAFTYPGLIKLYKEQQVFSESSPVYYSRGVVTSHPSHPNMAISYVLPEWFSIFDASMENGRAFEKTEELETFNPVTILTYDAWQEYFGGRDDILSLSLDIGGTSYRIIGVLDESYVDPEIQATGLTTQLFLPWDFNPQDEWARSSWGNVASSQTLVGKLNQEMLPVAIDANINPIVSDTWAEQVAGVDFFNGWSVSLEAKTLKSEIIGDSEKIVVMLIAGALGLVIIVSSNIMNLFMSRTVEQQRTLAIRAALGANKRALFTLLLNEMLALMSVAVVIALIASNIGFAILRNKLDEIIPRVGELSTNYLTVSVAIFALFLFSFIFATLCSNIINYRRLNLTLQSSGKGSGVQVSATTRQVLVGVQVGFAISLIFLNLGLFKNANDLVNAPMGFETNGIYDLRLSGASNTEFSITEFRSIYDEVETAIRNMPEVKEISYSATPLDNFDVTAITEVLTGQRYSPELVTISENYFNMVEQSLVEGTFISKEDFDGRGHVVVINEVLADVIGEGSSVLGREIQFEHNDERFTVPMQIVGVIKGASRPGFEDVPGRIYVSRTFFEYMDDDFMVQLNPGVSLSREALVEVVSGVTSEFTVNRWKSLETIKADMILNQTITLVTTLFLLILSVVMAAIGLYGVVNYSSHMRRFEIGTRIAIGAKPFDLVKLFIANNIPPFLSGAVLSVVLMLLLNSFTPINLVEIFGVQMMVGVYAITILISLVTLLGACYFPLRKYIYRPAITSLRG